MNSKKAIYSVAAISVFAGLVLLFLSGSHSSGTPTTTTSIQAQANSSKTLFADTQYAPYSYLISSGQLSQQAQAALTGFNMTVKQSNGTKLITMALAGTSTNSTFTVPKGYSLYIVETTFGDDGYGYDSSLGDDGFVLVDSNGYVAQ
jgi:hypothetical protein